MSYDPRDDDYDTPTPIERESCEHEDVQVNRDNETVCQNCGDNLGNFEPTDAQIFAHYGQTKELKAA